VHPIVAVLQHDRCCSPARNGRKVGPWAAEGDEMRRLLAIVAVLSAAGVLLPACTGGQPTPTATPDTQVRRAGGAVVFGTQGETTGWLPTTDRWGPGPMNVARAVFDPLVVADANGAISPWLAESFTPQDDFRTWIIKIRPGIRFTNGEPVDGHAVVYNLRAFQTSPLTTFALRPVREVEKVADDVVKVTLDQSWAVFPSVFTTQAGFMVAPEQLRNESHDKPIGSGPFELRDWKPDAELTVARNPGYWRKDAEGNALPYLDSVVFKPTPDETTRLNGLNAGDLDLIQTNSPTLVTRAQAGELADVIVLADESEGDEMNVVLNTQSGPTSDLRLRKALQFATDRDKVREVMGENFAAADGPFTPNSPWWTASGWPEPDLVQARQLVAAHQADNPGPVKIGLAVLATPDGLRIAQLLQSMWQDAGFEVEISSQEETRFSQTLVNGAFDALVYQYWNGVDPDSNYTFWSGSNIGPAGGISLNFPRWTNEQTQRALDAGRATTDPAARKAEYATVWRQWAENVPFLWLFHSKWLILTRPNVHGIGDVSLPDGSGMAQPISWGSINLSNTWVAR
jgi:peptide/nickel transport system substrate-binding protein